MPFQKEYINKIEHLEFLDKLNNYLNDVNIQSNSSSYTSQSKTIIRTEFEKLIEILDHTPYIICPITINEKCSIGFEIVNPLSKEKLLTFSEKHLPNFFSDIAKHFMNPKNVYIAKQLGYEMVPDRKYYL